MEQSRFVLKIVRRLTQQLSVKLLQFVFARVDLLADAKVGTMCSGSGADFKSLITRAQQQTLAEVFQITWHFEHKFSAERRPGKQHFIQAVTGGVPFLFSDLLQMANDEYTKRNA